MNCHKCPYQKQIDALRAHCLACDPESTAGTPHNRVRADEFTLNAVPVADGYANRESTADTHLDPDDEDKLRVAMAALWSLDPMDLLLVQTLMRGGTLESYGDMIASLVRQAKRYRGAPRAMAWARKAKLLRRLPMLTAVLRNDRENDSAARIERELKRAR